MENPPLPTVAKEKPWLLRKPRLLRKAHGCYGKPIVAKENPRLLRKTHGCYGNPWLLMETNGNPSIQVWTRSG